jgi:2-polyprenyl-6-hydroxyphenyl methylase/3-demethylubiquinone-9 3-methyltransferase
MQEFNVILADIQNQKTAQIIKEKFGLFDVVVASEVIEHLSNVGLFLDNVKALLKADGLFLLTTPNAQHIRHIIMPYSHSYDHMVSFTMQLLQQILTHHGFTIREKTYLFWIPPKSFIEKVYRNKVIAGLASRLLADTLGVVASPLFLER